MKKIILGLAVVAMAAATSAFTTGNTKNINGLEYGVLSENPLNYQVTENSVSSTHNCGLSNNEPCTVESSIAPQQAMDGLWYIDKSPEVTEISEGPFSE